MPQNEIRIDPGIGVMGTFRSLGYKPWNALAEYIDNSLQSSIEHHDELKRINGSNYKLRVIIEINTNESEIIIRDNAAGISGGKAFDRAFKIASRPENNEGLSEFGMGLKAASTWFADDWSVISTSINENVERTVRFDVNEILRNETLTLPIKEFDSPLDNHYTVIILKKVRNMPNNPSTRKKIKSHLTSIYRNFINDGCLELIFDQEELVFERPAILNKPYYKNYLGESILWKKDIDFSFPDLNNNKELRVTGYVGLLETMSSSINGFALFRRGRVIEGNEQSSQTFKPSLIFGNSTGSHLYKRLFGELNLDGFPVTFTKDGFIPGPIFEQFLHVLRDDLKNDPELPILKQGLNFRINEYDLAINPPPSEQDQANIATQQAVNDSIPNPTALAEEMENTKEDVNLKNDEEEKTPNPTRTFWKDYELTHGGYSWNVHVECTNDENITKLFDVGDHILAPELRSGNSIGVRVSLSHPFVRNLANNDRKVITPITRIAVAVALTETIASNIGVDEVGISGFRTMMNQLLSNSLSEKSHE